MKQTDFAQYLKKYIRIYLPGIKVCSSRTIEEYDRVFKIFIYFLDEYEKFDALKFTMKLFNKELIEKFLFYLEKERNCSNKTINHRHSVINSFCKFVCREAPSLMFQLQAIIGIPYRKEIQEFRSYATPEGISLILSQVQTCTKTGIRDLAMFSFMYDTGCRVSELCDMKPKNLRLVSSPIVYITGKGGKCRTVPLQQKDVEILGIYMKIYNLNKTNTNECYLFPNHNGYRITG
ncbi:MAG: tyrosine-type recombinase/integrase, partial [Methanomethylophilus sp.]